MAWWLGTIAGHLVGAFLFIAVFSWGLTKLARRFLPDPNAIVAGHVAAYVVCVTIYGWGNADGGPFDVGLSPITYGAVAALMGFLAVRAYRRQNPS